MDKQTIEEMVKDIFDYARTLVDIKTATEDCRFVDTYKGSIRGYAMYLLNEGYRKIPENAVVLTGDELRLYNENIERDREMLKTIRKDTAKEILTELKPVIINYLEEYMVSGGEGATEYFENLCKRYGVEGNYED